MALTSADEWYFVYENRLASFHAHQPATKRRTSNANSRAPKTLAWPHKSLSPADLARAGFFFEPHPNNPDNVVCFLCNRAIDGWEEGDDPLGEHLRHSPTCGWAIVSAVEVEVGDYAKIHPLDPVILEARKATFAGKWPYESKKGFKCKTKQLAEAGWKYTPTNESDDMTTCAYCQLGLDGWESGDKPIDEHHKRAPDRPYFQLIDQLPAPKKGRSTKAARASKASRLSIQSVATVASEFPTLGDVTADHDDSVMTTTSVVTQGGRKTAKGRKTTTAKGRKTRAKKDDAVEVVEEDQNVGSPPPQPLAKQSRGRKRASDAVEDSVITNVEAPAPKKRATRGRVSNAVDVSVLDTTSQDTEMPDTPPAKRPTASKKSRVSAAKNTRKVSSAPSLRSQASTASLRAHVTDDDEIDRQLQADLERPFTDDEDVAADSDSERKKAAPAKGGGRKGTISKKSAVQTQESSDDYAMFDPTPAEPDEADIDAELKALEIEMNAEEQAKVLEVPKKGRKTGTRKASRQTKKAKEPAPTPPPADPVDEFWDEEIALVEPPPALAPAPAPEPEVAEDPDSSSGTVVNKTASARPNPGKKGKGRAPKKTNASRAKTDDESQTGDAEAVIPAQPKSPPPAPAQALEKVASYTPSGPPPSRTEKALPPPPPPFSITRKPAPGPITPRANHISSVTPANQAALSPSQSPQSSDAENQPPSARPAHSSSNRNAVAAAVGVAGSAARRVVLAPVEVATTPMRSPSRRNVVAGLQSTARWTPVDLDLVFGGSSSPGRGGASAEAAGKENGGPAAAAAAVDRLLRRGAELTSPEKGMTVEEWIYHNAGLAERKLRHECETMVSAFEREGTRAMGVLEGLVVD